MILSPHVLVRVLTYVIGVEAAITLDVTSTDSIKNAASTAAWGMVKYYTGNNTGDVPGNLPSPYYWWEAGAMFGALIDYWHYTGDTTYNTITTQALLHQVGSGNDFMPSNQTKDEGNDDQSFWGLTAMAAAEYTFPNPPSDQPQWLALAQAVFNTQIARWDTSTCNGGLRWQIFSFNSGYDYKNSISNGCLFNMAARLARYTDNSTYLDWANRAWDWVSNVGLMDSTYHFYDGSDDTLNCSSVDHIQWTYNAGVFMYGAAIMYNISATNDSTSSTTALWKSRVDGILNSSSIFFNNSVMYEVACETNGKCDVDQRSFKAHLARWMAATAKVAPFSYSSIYSLLSASAQAAARTCTAGDDGNQCGLRWTLEANDGSVGVGEQMSALEVFQSLLVESSDGPVTNTTGGTSTGDYSAGTSPSTDQTQVGTITTGEKAGAGLLTVGVLVGIFGGAWFVVS